MTDPLEPRTFALTVAERVHASNLLPTEAQMLILRVVRIARETLLGFSDEDTTTYEIAQSETQITWNKLGNTDTRDVLLSPRAVGLIKKALEKLDADKKLQLHHYTLVEKFAPELLTAE